MYIFRNLKDMGMTVIEKILAAHSGRDFLEAGEIAEVRIDARAARDFGGANVVKHERQYAWGGRSFQDLFHL